MAFKEFWINHLGGMTGWLPTNRLLGLTNQRLVLPFYHAISDEPLPHIQPLYPTVSPVQFRSDLDFLLKNFKAISMTELQRLISLGHRPNEPVFHLSFDDGLRSCVEEIAPVLEGKGVPATFFVNSAFVDNKALFYRYKAAIILDRWAHLDETHQDKVLAKYKLPNEKSFFRWVSQLKYSDPAVLGGLAEVMEINFNEFLAEQRPYMSRDDIMKLQHRGFSIGAHSVDHPLFSSISAEDQKSQVLNSLAFLENEFGLQQRLFAFPFTDDGVSADFLKWLHDENGGNVNLSFGTAGLKQDVVPGHLQRIPMEGYRREGAEIINAELTYYLMKRMTGKNQRKR